MKQLSFIILVITLSGHFCEVSGQQFIVRNPDVIPLIYLGETVPLRDYSEDPDAVNEITRDEKLGYHGKHDWPLHQKVNPNARPAGKDPALQDWYPTGPGLRTIGQNYEAQDYSFVNPPDPSMDVGPNHVIQMINAGSGATFQIWDKSGTTLMASTLFDNFFGFPGGLGDPIVLYDQLADRWLMSEFASGSDAMHVAISSTPDPLGTWHTYIFTTPDFPDYPKFAVWHDAYYVTTNESAPAVYALDRTQMLNGDPATSQRFTMPEVPTLGFQTATPVGIEGASPAPGGTPGYIMRMVDDGWGASINEDYLEIWEFDVDWVTPANSTLSGPDTLHTQPFDTELCGYQSFSCIEQPGGGSADLDPLREVLMNRVHYRNFGTYETIICNHVTDVDNTDHAGVRWYELRKVADWSVFQQGTYAPDGDSRWMAALAMNDAGAIGLAYNVSSSSTFPSLRYTGRRECDPLGVMTEPETSIIEGTASNGSNRYGDYSAMSVDPANGYFWFTGEYNPSSQWSTRIVSFSLPDCSPSVSFESVASSVAEADADIDLWCYDYKDHKVPISIGLAPTQPATITFNLSGAATSGFPHDYEIFPPTISLHAGNLTDTVTVRVYNDPYVEADETVVIDYTLDANGGDAIAGAFNQTHTVTILSDDLDPASASIPYVFLDEDLNGAVTGWTVVDGGETPDTWELTTGYDGDSDNSLDGTQFYLCDSDAAGSGNMMNEELTSPVFNTAEAASLTLEFDHYFNEYGPGFNETIDVDVYDGSTWQNVYHVEENTQPGDIGDWGDPVTESIDITAHANANMQLRFTYIAQYDWWWAIDNIKVTGTSSVDVQTAMNTTMTDAQYVGPFETVHFYDDATGNVMATITNNSNVSYGCTTVEVDRPGAPPSAEPFNSYSPSTLLHSKTFKVTPEFAVTGYYDLTLYYQEAEVTAWEAATGLSRNDAGIIKVPSPDVIADVNPFNYSTFNFETSPATVGTFGSDVTFTSTFSSGFSGFGVGRFCDLIVTSANDAGSGTLREVLMCAADGDTVRFDASVHGSDIVLSSGPVELAKDVMLLSDVSENITIDASSIGRAIHVQITASAEIHGLHIASGTMSSGRGILNEGALLIKDVTIDDHPVAAPGQLLTNLGALEVQGDCNVQDP